MSRLDTAYGSYQVLRISVAAVANALVGRLDRRRADALLAGFAQRIIDRFSIRLTVVRDANTPTDQAFVYMSNHQSLLDIPVLYAALPGVTLRMVAKSELFRIPIWGAGLRVGEMIDIDRSNRDSAIASLKRAQELIRSGVNVWIAPEGQRTRTGSVGPLKKGGFHLAKDTGSAIVPVAINGTIAVLPPESSIIQRNVPVHVRVGRPIVCENRSVDELMNEVSAFFAKHVRQVQLT